MGSCCFFLFFLLVVCWFSGNGNFARIAFRFISYFLIVFLNVVRSTKTRDTAIMGSLMWKSGYFQLFIMLEILIIVIFFYRNGVLLFFSFMWKLVVVRGTITLHFKSSSKLISILALKISKINMKINMLRQIPIFLFLKASVVRRIRFSQSTYSHVELEDSVEEQFMKDWRRVARREKEKGRRSDYRFRDRTTGIGWNYRRNTRRARTATSFVPILEREKERERNAGWIVIDRATDVSTPLSIASIETYILSCHRLKPWIPCTRCPFDSKKFLHCIFFPNIWMERRVRHVAKWKWRC